MLCYYSDTSKIFLFYSDVNCPVDSANPLNSQEQLPRFPVNYKICPIISKSKIKQLVRFVLTQCDHSQFVAHSYVTSATLYGSRLYGTLLYGRHFASTRPICCFSQYNDKQYLLHIIQSIPLEDVYNVAKRVGYSV